ncbi:MAG: PEGA domain-containing protein, partial [Candidatus Aminicenantales bacterium]
LQTQVQLIREIETRMEENKQLIRERKDFDKAIHVLYPLIAKTFRVEDNQKQKELATEIFLWVGMAYLGKGDTYRALQEIKNMFEVDHAYGKQITRNIYDPKVVSLIEQAEKEVLGIIHDYSLKVTTDPDQAEVVIDGKPAGRSPILYRSESPKMTVEIKKKGYKTVREEMFLTQETATRHYVLERLGRDLEVRSSPPEARVYLDAGDTEKRTPCVLENVAFGNHEVRLEKEAYAPWKNTVAVSQGEGPQVLEVFLTGMTYVPWKRWGSPKSRVFEKPSALTLDSEGHIYIADRSSEKLKKITADGRMARTWASGGRDLKGLKAPGGVAVDAQGSIYVTDAQKHCVMKFDPQGRLIKKWGKEGSGNTKFNTPLGIAVDSQSRVYVADSLNHCVKIFSHLGIFQKVLGKRGIGEGEFAFPTAVAVNEEDEIYVLDRMRLQKFSSDGKVLGAWGRFGTGQGEFNKPMGLCVDAQGYVYVADSGNHRIQKFDPEGRFIAAWGSKGTAEGQMGLPVGVAVDASGRVYVVETENNRIQVFQIPSDAESQGGSPGRTATPKAPGPA